MPPEENSDLAIRPVLPKVAANGFLAHVFLSFVASAGIFYISALPALVSAMVEGLGFSEQQAGYAVSANAYGSMSGALIAVFLIRRLPWKRTVGLLFSIMIVMELSSTLITSPVVMVGWRFLLGTFGGCSVGIGLAIMARLANPDKGFGFLLAIQVGFGGLIIYLRRLVEPALGVSGVFVLLALLVSASLICVLFLQDYKVAHSRDKPRLFPALSPMSGLTLVAIFLYQAMANGTWAYMERIGLGAGLDGAYVSRAAAVGAWIGAVGGLVPIFLGLRLGRFWPILLALALSLLAAVALGQADVRLLYFAGNVFLSFAWSVMIAYSFGLAAHYDRSGHLMVLGGTVSKFGLATGPLLAARLVGGGGYSAVITMAAIGFVLCLAVIALPSLRADRILKRQILKEKNS